MRYTYNKERRDPQIQSYTTTQGKKWRIKFSIVIKGRKHNIEKQGFVSFDAARSEKKNLLNNLESGINISNVTVREYFEAYCEENLNNGSWRYPTYKRNSGLFKNHFFPKWGSTKMSDVDRWSYQIWFTSYTKEKDFSLHTARNFNNTISTAFNNAVLNDVIVKNPIRKIKVTGRQPRNTAMTRTEFETIFSFIKSSPELSTHERTMALLTMIGLRHEEIDGIKLKYVKDNMIGVFEVLNSHSQITEPKTQSSKRWVPMTPIVEEYINRTIQESKIIYAQNKIIMSDDDFIFVNHLAKHISYNDLSNVFHLISSKTGIHVWPHKMRHAFSTIAFGIEGLNPRDIANILGHSKIDMSLYYNNGTDEGKIAAMKKIGNSF